MPPRKKASAPQDENRPINPYLFKLRPGVTQDVYDRAAFARRVGVEFGAPSRYDLFKGLADKFLPGHFEWHAWTEKTIRALCEMNNVGKEGKPQHHCKSYSLVGFPGASGSAKTFNVSSFAALWWAIDPEVSNVITVSTSKGSLRRRAWNEIKNVYSKFTPRIGNFVDSRMVWQASKGDDRNAIIGKAVEEGSTAKVADDIKGVHTRRQMVIIDEATSVPSAIYEACGNLYSYPEEFILVLIGNPLNRLDQFGRFCEPVGGWTSVTVETGEWDGRPQEAVGGHSPRIITFDAEKSPNIMEGRIVSRHLPMKEEVERARKNSGGGNSPTYWQNKRGFWPPEGLSKTVFTASAIARVNAGGKMQFTGKNFQIIGMLDPAFGGGDLPALRFAKMGEIAGGKWGIELQPAIILQLDSTSTNPVHYQLSEQTRRHCEKVIINGTEYHCLPENFALDATGEGGGLADIMQRTWSPRIIRIEFGSSASEDPISLEDIRPSKEVYRNKRAEMWFRSRTCMDSGQWAGIDTDTAEELCTMKFDDDGKKITLMAKKDYKEEFKKSPDRSDCFIAGTMVLTDNGEIPIETVKVGDSIVTPFGSSLVEAVQISETDELTNVDFSNGRSLCGKGNHKVFTWGEGWVKLSELSLTPTVESDINLPIWNLLNLLFTKDESIVFKHLVDTIKTKTGSVSQRDFYTELSGLKAMELYQKTGAFITKTMTGRITDWKTFALCQGGNMQNSIRMSGIKTQITENAQLPNWTPIDTRHQRGTAPQKDLNGTLKTPKSVQKNDQSGSLNAKYVARFTKQNIKGQLTHALRVAGIAFSTLGTVLFSLKEFAKYAVLNLVEGLSIKRHIAPITVQQSQLQESRKVYNLTLENHNVYYANGILVQNCAVGLTEVARLRGFRLAPMEKTVERFEQSNKLAETAQQVYETIDYAPEVIEESEYAQVI